MEKKRKVTKSETDIAYEILKQRKSPMHYKELIGLVLEQMGLDPAAPGNRLVQIHTEINLDNRFAFLGKGVWGLTAWSPKQNRPVAAADPKERSYQPKPSDYLWEEDAEDVDDEEDLLVPDDDFEEDDELAVPVDDEEADDSDDDDEDAPPSCMRVFRP